MKRVLDPIDRVAEVLFGLIMVLTFTGSLSVASAGHAEIRTMMLGAFGCNLAWGVIDALFYLMACLGERGHSVRALHAVREAAGPEEGRRILADALPPFVVSILEPSQIESIRQRVVGLPDPPSRPNLRREDWWAAVGVCLLVFASTLPAVLPFVFLRDIGIALRLSNGIAVAMLFLCGYSVGSLTGYHRWGTGFAMVVLGSALVAMTMALGG